MVARPSDVFVGRRDELVQLISALEDAEAGRGSLVMLAGEPGIGKTRIIEELCREARDGGARVCWGVSHESAGAPPYWPWVQVIESLLRDRDPDVLRTEMGAGAAVIAEVVPAVRERLPDLEAPVDVGPEQARFRLFDSVTTFLKNAAAKQPVVLVLDDLHWADRSSLDLLEFVGSEVGASHLLVVGAYRDVELSRQHPLSESLAALSRERRFQRIVLRGLGKEDTGRLVEVVGQFTPSGATIDAIHERTEGNPFFVTEVTRDLAREAISPEGDLIAEGLRIPEGVREAIGARLNRLSDGCNMALRSAAVIGREFNFALLAAVSEELTEEVLLAALDDALDAHVIRGLPGPGERYEFAHALIQQTVADELSMSRRARLHARIVGALEELYGDRPDEHVGELAHHCAEAETVVGADKVARYAQMAGERALASYAFEEARAHFDRALTALEGRPPDARMAAILFGLGKAETQLLAYPDTQRGWDNVARAFDLYEELGEPQAAIAVAMQSRGLPPFHLHGTADVFSRALEMAVPDSAETGHLLRLYAGALRFEREDAAGSLKALEQALAIAKRTGDRQLEAFVLAALGRARVIDLDFRGGVETGLKAIELLRQTDQLHEEMISHYFMTSALISLGDTDGAWHHLEAERRLRAQLGLDAGTLAWNQYLISYLRGDRAGMDEVGEVLDRENPSDSVIRLIVGMGAWHAERQSDLEARIQAAKETGLTSPVMHQRSSSARFLALAARLMDRSGDATQAGEIGRSLLSMPRLTPENEANARIAAGLAAVATGDAQEATEHYQRLKNLRGTLAGWDVPISGDRLLGLLAHAAEMPGEVAAHFEEALDFSGKAGYRLEVAWTCHDYAESLLDQDEHSDVEEAVSLIERGLEIASELGLVALEERLIGLREMAESVSAPSPPYPGGLNGREVEVLQLIAAGMSNRQIADELFISRSTAANHVRNILTKTDCANRTQAATYANRHGLTADRPAD